MLLNCGVGEDSWESPGLQGDQPVHPEGDQSWVFIGRTDVKAETPILWPPDAKSWLIWKDPDAGKDWGQEEKWMTEDEMVGWHHQLSGHEFEWTPGVGDGQGGWRAAVHGVAKSQTQLSDWTELSNLFHLAHALEVYVWCSKWWDFPFMAESYSTVHIYYIFFIHSPADRHLSYSLGYCE